jgi:hypothetical protein
VYINNEIDSIKAELALEKEKSIKLQNQIDSIGSEEGFFTLAVNSGNIDMCRIAVRHPSCPVELLAEVSSYTNDPDLIIDLLENQSLPTGSVEYLVICNVHFNEPDDKILAAAAKNRSCSAETLAQISWYSNFRLQPLIELQPSYLLSELVALLSVQAVSFDSVDREQVAQCPLCPVDILILLGKDPNIDVSASAKGNQWHPIKNLNEIIEREDIETLMLFFDESDVATNLFIAAYDKCHPSILDMLAKNDNVRIRSAVANNPNCSQSLYRMLAKDSDGSVRIEVARNHNTPASVLKELSVSAFYEYRVEVALNPRTPRDVIESLAKDTEFHVRDAIKRRFSGRN